MSWDLLILDGVTPRLGLGKKLSLISADMRDKSKINTIRRQESRAEELKLMIKACFINKLNFSKFMQRRLFLLNLIPYCIVRKNLALFR